jgi:hypothetical protein
MMVFENMVLRKTFGPKKEEVTGGWGILHNKEIYYLYPLPSIIWVSKSRWMKCVWRVALLEENRNT